MQSNIVHTNDHIDYLQYFKYNFITFRTKNRDVGCILNKDLETRGRYNQLPRSPTKKIRMCCGLYTQYDINIVRSELK